MAESPEDFVRVATCSSPTDAYLLRGVLQTAGLDPFVADANLAQAHPWMTHALGGVRVLVPGHQVEAARQAIADYEAGRLQLEGESTEGPAPVPPLPAPVFSPDQAVLWSFLLTPVFGAAVQVINDRVLPDSPQRRSRLVWLVLLTVLTLAGLVIGFEIEPGPFFVLRTSWVLSFFTVVWYFLAGSAQSKVLIAGHGLRFRRRSLWGPAVATGAAEVLVGAGLHWLLP